jgi:phage shock protein A
MEQPKLKNFWERPEGNTGLAFLTLLGAGAVVGLYYALPFIITLLANTLYAIGLGAALFAIVVTLMNDGFRATCSAVFQSAMRSFTGFFIAVDPIGILKGCLQQMKVRLRKIEKHIVELSGQIQNLKRTLDDKKADVEKNLKTAAAAKGRGMKDHAALEANKAARGNEFIKKFSVALAKMEAYQNMLVKMKKNLVFLYEDTEDNVKSMQLDFDSTAATYKAMKGVEALIDGDNNKELFDQAMEYAANDIANKLGEIDRIMDTSKDFMTSMDLTNAVFNEEGLELLTHWEKNGSSILDYENNRNKKFRVDSSVSSDTMGFEEQETALENNNTNKSFAQLFNK